MNWSPLARKPFFVANSCPSATYHKSAPSTTNHVATRPYHLRKISIVIDITHWPALERNTNVYFRYPNNPKSKLEFTKSILLNLQS
jgi:hypothetical protein